MGVKLYVGGHAGTVQKEREDLTGFRCFTAAHRPQVARNRATVVGLLDSGAFTDPPERRLTPEQSLDRQLAWERKASDLWQIDRWQAHALVSYDLLIDETWVAGQRHKRRWSIQQAEMAVSETVRSAHYLSEQRGRLRPRKLVLSAQGVDAIQYRECATEVLRVADPDDWFGLGGWCIVGRNTSLLPVLWQTLYSVLPMVAVAGLKHVHIFGVLYLPALGGLLWLADRHGLTVSTDSTRPVLACTYKNKKKAGVRVESGYWRDEVAWWQTTLKGLRESQWYRKPPERDLTRQLSF